MRHQVLAEHATHEPVGRLWQLIGVNSHEFSKLDKGVFVWVFADGVWQMGSFIVLLILGAFGFMSTEGWFGWWHLMLVIILVTTVVGVIWFSIPGLFDLRKMYHRLATMKRNDLDDGRVVSDHLLSENETQPEE